ncbi:hypothetical protein [Phenylobacterium sp. NIBR 498073]|jgi:hypothetical protein|uniref:hypothetical protein n=1 Tax=Phenylobacterium sp. NIBR 498073 TaxID=3015177 RepID=UPI0022B2DF9D|nr:hypothetical protein [Phenylobacterium sp. NIBR 498073]WGU40338.1 hypothetical protein O4N75_01075 [Phenylobacterium sp. NIBR 498073]
MNAYDRLPPLAKLLHLILLIAPVAAAGILTQSWRVAGETFLWGTLFLGGAATFAIGRFIRAIIRETGDEDLDAYRFRRVFIWAFLLTGPAAGIIVAYLAVT